MNSITSNLTLLPAISASSPISALMREYLEFLGKEQHASLHTVHGYRADLIQFEHFITGQIGHAQTQLPAGPIDQTIPLCTSWHVHQYIDYLHAQNYTVNSVARKMSSLRTFYNFLIQRGRITANPLAAIKTPKRQVRPRELLHRDQLQRLLQAPGQRTHLAARDTAILQLLCRVGVRVRELVDLKIADLNLVAHTLHIPTRPSHGRSLALGDNTTSALTHYFQLRAERGKCHAADAEWVFLNGLGHRLSERSIRRKIDKYLSLASLPCRIRPNDLRHSFALQLSESDASNPVPPMPGEQKIAPRPFEGHSFAA